MTTRVAGASAFCHACPARGQSRAWGVVTPMLSAGHSYVSGWPSRMSKALPKGGGALARAWVTNTRLRPGCPFN